MPKEQRFSRSHCRVRAGKDCKMYLIFSRDPRSSSGGSTELVWFFLKNSSSKKPKEQFEPNSVSRRQENHSSVTNQSKNCSPQRLPASTCGGRHPNCNRKASQSMASLTFEANQGRIPGQIRFDGAGLFVYKQDTLGRPYRLNCSSPT